MNSDLLQQNEALQKEGKGVLDDLQLIPLLERFGTVYSVGSYALGLMVWRDIDIEVVVSTPADTALIGVITGLLQQKYRRFDFTIIDNRQFDPTQPNGLYLGMKYYGHPKDKAEYKKAKERLWKIDLWLLGEDKEQTGKNQTERLKKQLTPEKREQILEIKSSVYQNPGYRHAYYSTDIYKAVLEEGVTDLEGFKKYLGKIGREL